ncbi:Mu-like prophage FluMu protein gp28 [Balnearium lithotrophicum]|uniref:Mu-like prophage FluMu protein gp28 n=1 Tax=Balnearium lithotrophicum TaxID=223788 RepID=A0A521DZK3_9BACT|nr:terminase family protein [Balnearium lithotrophicum]SMO77157.1 Mu-like prophage FluMu protein gp28 [Balnearium lithotrophicum]
MAILLPYQIEIVKGIDSHKFSAIKMARQTGKSFVVSYWAAKRAATRQNHTIVVVSPTERQSKLFVDKVKLHVKALKLTGVKFFENTDLKKLEINFPNGSQIVALPANPDGIRGFSGDVIMDEAAFFRDWQEVYRAVFPIITRKKDYKLIAISTPFGKNDLFYYLWSISENNPKWFRYSLNIYEAVEKGLSVDIEELKAGIKSEDAWKTEYLVEFIDEADSVLPYELIQKCEMPKEEIILPDLREAKGNLYCGIDVGRRKDLTVITVVEKLGDVLYVRRIEELKKKPFREQIEIISHYAKFCRRVAVDETGLGMQLAEELKENFGSKVIPVYFSAKTKEELAEKLRTKFQDRLIRIPSDPDLREDLHSVRKTVTNAGNVRYEGSAKDSHADRFWSLALAVYAASQRTFNFIFKGVKIPWL